MPRHRSGARRRRAFMGAVARSAIACALAAACSVSDQQEVGIGQQNAAQINAQLPIITDPAIADYVQQLGARLAAGTSRANLDWHFYVVDSKEVNAFALPGGFIYVNRGLIEHATRMDELAGTLGHEIGHVVRRHSVQAMERAGGANVGLSLLCTLTRVCENNATRVAINVGGAAWFARHSRKDEAEADSEAVVNVTRAQIDPEGIPALFRVLLDLRQRQPGRVEAFFASHPLEEDRIAATQRLIATEERDLGAGAGSLARDDATFAAVRERIAALPAPHEPPADSLASPAELRRAPP